MSKKHLTDLCGVLAGMTSATEIREFLDGLLTAQELEDLPKRLQIVRLLKEGVSQREIAERLGVGIATVTRGSNELKKGRFSSI